MKKIVIPLIGFLLVLACVMGWRASTYSAADLPYSDPDTPQDGITTCRMNVANQIYLMRQAWKKNLALLMDTQKACSEKVDESFEGLRTYRCWLDYECEAVLYSGNADPAATQDSGGAYRALRKSEIAPIPGCADPENIQIPDLKIQYIPACKAGRENTLQQTQANFSDCQAMVQQDFADIPENPSKKDVDTLNKGSTAYIMLQKSLNACSADQEIRPLRDKFESILTKLRGMEGHMTTLKEQLDSLDARMSCFCANCD
jgi:hypothetical protein